MLCIAVGAGASGALNMWYDADIDAIMARTAKRPIPAGKVEAGALNASVWEKFVTEGKVDTAKVKVFYTTPGYFDYNWTVHADMPAALREKLAQAFLNLDASTPEGKEILALQRATRFIATKPENYQGIEQAARSAGLLK